MLENKTEESDAAKENSDPKEEITTTATSAPELPAPPPPPPPPQAQALGQAQPQSQSQLQSLSQSQNYQNSEMMLNPLNEPENITDSESKTKHRRYWTPKEEEKFYEIWGRENWRLTKHGKNTIFFAKWSDEMRERFNIDVKPEEVQCKVNQTRAKFRQVKKLLESDKNAVKWKKYDIVEKILKNQYRSKDDEPVPIEALENNRDVSPTELLNCATQPSSPSSISNMSNIQEQNINLSQSFNADHQLTDEVNLSNASLSDHNLFSNNMQSGNSFSTELFGSDHLEIKEEIENDLKSDGYTDITMGINQTADGGTTIDGSNSNKVAEQQSYDNHLTQHQQSLPQQVPVSTENATNMEHNQMNSSHTNSFLVQNRLMQNHNNSATADGVVNFTNHANSNNNAMQPPRTMIITPSPRKRIRTTPVNSVTPISSENLEALYLEEVRKKNVILVEQGEISRKRLRLEERKVKLMEEFFPKFMNLQQEILQKLDSVTTANNIPEAINIKLED